MNRIAKNTHELRNGDIVRTHGATFRLRDRQEHDHGPRHVITFKTDLLALDGDASMRHFEADKWIIQGNELARWSVLESWEWEGAATMAAYVPPAPPKRPTRTYWRIITDAFSGDETVVRHGRKYYGFAACAAAADRLGEKYVYAYCDVQEYDSRTNRPVPANAI